MTEFSHPAIGAALTTAASLLGMETVFIGALTDDTFTFVRTEGRWRGVTPGDACPRQDSLCDRMLAGAPLATADAANDPHYMTARMRIKLGITSYVGVPLRGADGALLGTLAAVDRGSVPVDSAAVRTLQHLATAVALVATSPLDQGGADHGGDSVAAGATTAGATTAGTTTAGAAVIVRTPTGWRVGSEEMEDLTTAMVLCDLLAGELPPGARPDKDTGGGDEVAALRLAVRQLEHALTARIAIEQAIGVVAERFRTPPRDAFESLRRASRASGRRVYDVARELTSSTTSEVPTLPQPLRRR
ncbi:MAG: hypothetical protein QOI42_1744 [Frankiaceae bacterium]|nr:hypothetical protein [Frankiaceae bacterium]